MSKTEKTKTDMEKPVIFKTSALCPKCSKPLYTSDVDTYPLVCIHCDENFYGVEVKQVDDELFEIGIPMVESDYLKKLPRTRKLPHIAFIGYDDVLHQVDLGFDKNQIPDAEQMNGIVACMTKHI